MTMGPGMGVLTMVVVFLVVWYGTLAVSDRKRKNAGSRTRSSRSSPSSSSVDASTQAAIDTVIICSTIDAGHHG